MSLAVGEGDYDINNVEEVDEYGSPRAQYRDGKESIRAAFKQSQFDDYDK